MGETGSGEQPHVVMLVGNDVTFDTRVRKIAQAVAELGIRVTVVGIGNRATRHDSMIGNVRIIRLAVDFTSRDKRNQSRLLRRKGQFSWVTKSAGNQVSTRRDIALTQRLADDRSGIHRLLSERWVRLRKIWLKGKAYALSRIGDMLALSLKVFDRAQRRNTLVFNPRRIIPEVDDYELAFGPIVDELHPDLIHAHDIHFVGVAARAVRRRQAHGEQCAWVYDAHEWVRGISLYGSRTARIRAAWAKLEKTWIHSADRVMTVSPPLARRLQDRYHLATLPDVVCNIPAVNPDARAQRTVRQAIGLEPEVPLMVYSGGVQIARGIDTAVAALQYLPEVHLVLVAVPNAEHPTVTPFVTKAQQLGVADRFHVLDPVASDQVVHFLSSSDVGLIPLRHFGSHDVALANKLFEYLHAGLPMVVSDCPAQAEFVRTHQVGEVHVAGDAKSLADAVRAVLSNREKYHTGLTDPKVLKRNSWSAQVEILQQVYKEMLTGYMLRPRGEHQLLAAGEVTWTRPPMLAIGPANSAGQGWAWARAAAHYLPGVTGWNVAIRNMKYDYPADETVDVNTFLHDVDWQMRMVARSRLYWTHALLEAGRPIFGGYAGRDFVADANILASNGVFAALVFHGSEIRDPRRHRQTHEFSPFRDPQDPLTKKLQVRFDRLMALVSRYKGHFFVSTPDQKAYLPDRARWLPVVVDTQEFSPVGISPAMERDIPLVVHAPSNSQLKGTKDVHRILQPLVDKGYIELQTITGVAPKKAAAIIRQADIVIDQLLLGLYGVLACEAMSCGRVVLGHVGDDLRSRIPSETPIIEATPTNLYDVVEQVVSDRDWARSQALQGPAFVSDFHDGRRSAAVLAEFMGIELPATG